MWSFLSVVLLLVPGLVQGISSNGNRLLVVIEEAAEQDKYSQFFNDLTGSAASK